MERKKILVVCIHNSARSQMAEAFINKYGKNIFFAESASLKPGNLNQNVVKVMQEINIDISKNKTKSVNDFYNKKEHFDYVTTVCDEGHSKKCPVFPGIISQLHWPFEDPSSLTGKADEKLSQTRIICDQIKEKVVLWLDSFNNWL